MANEAFRILATLADRIIAVEGRMRNLEGAFGPIREGRMRNLEGRMRNLEGAFGWL